MRRVLLATTFLLVAAAPDATAQNNDCLADLKMPAVGRWAEYEGVLNKEPYTIRYAVIGAEEREGKALKWMEVRMAGAKPDKNMIYQILTPGTPSEIDQAQEVVVKMGPKPAMRLPSQMLGMIRGQLGDNSPLANLCEGVSMAGEESVTVPAGTFTALRYHNAKHDSDTWVVPDQPFIMVKTKGKTFELSMTRSGNGAKSSLTETPRDMPGLAPPK
jgi:hypothetical protein